jgi:hypothetical protein
LLIAELLFDQTEFGPFELSIRSVGTDGNILQNLPAPPKLAGT